MKMSLYIVCFVSFLLIGQGSSFLVNPDPVFIGPENKGRINDKHVDEVSGLAFSRLHQNILYAHNDKGDGPNIYAVEATNGHVVATFDVHGAHNYDWEDITYGTCGASVSNTYCLYLGDIGDHSGDGARNIIYKVREPTTIQDDNLQVEDSLSFSWPSSNVDAETLMLDHRNGDLLVISKIDGGRGQIARLPVSAWESDSTYQVGNVATLNINTHHHDPRGGDISTNGQEVLIKADKKIYYWQSSDPNVDYLQLLTQTPGTVEYTVEHQGEAVCWDSGAKGYYTLGEGSHQEVQYYRRQA